MDLVDDHALDADQTLSGLGGQHEIQRFRCGNQHLGRRALHALAFFRARIAGANAHAHRTLALSHLTRDRTDAGQRRAQIAIHVDPEGLEWGDVERSNGAGFGRFGELRRGAKEQTVDHRKKGRERFTRTGWREQERVLSGSNQRPGTGLHRRGVVKDPLEPSPRRWVQGVKGQLRDGLFRIRWCTLR